MKLSKSATNKYITNSNTFLCADNISFYLLGAYMTDGCINDLKHHINFSISSKDKDWLESIRYYICPEKPIYKKSSNCFSFEASNIDCINWLISYGCTPRKSTSLKIEKDIPIQYHRDFIRGVLDGDGSISTCKYKKTKGKKEYWYTKTHVYICSASKQFINQISQFIPQDIKFSISTRSPKNHIINGKKIIGKYDMHYLQFNDSHAKKFLTWCYYDGHKLSLNRKYNLTKQILVS